MENSPLRSYNLATYQYPEVFFVPFVWYVVNAQGGTPLPSTLRQEVTFFLPLPAEIVYSRRFINRNPHLKLQLKFRRMA